MLTLIATCYLAGQMLFAVPDGWAVQEVYSGGSRPFSHGHLTIYCPAECEAERTRVWVRLMRTATVGETVDAPKECTLTVRAEEKR